MTGPSETTEPSVERGLPDRASAVALLNEAYGDWGDEALFSWKYDRYPWFEPDRCFSVDVDGELVAFRRLFDRSIRGRRDVDLFVLGDTCVAPDHQGEGLYSALHAATTEAARDAGADGVATFNRRGTITFAANRDRGWAWRPVPLWLRILRPSVVLPEYANLALEDDSRLAQLLREYGHTVELRLPDGRVRADRLVGTGDGPDDSDSSDDGVTVPLPVPSRVLEAGVEAVVGDPIDAVRRRFPTGGSNGPDLLTTTVRQEFAADERDEILALYETVLEGYDLAFRRDTETVDHLLDHPTSVGTVTVRRGDELLGFAPVCLKREGAVLQAHALDFVVSEDAAVEPLAAGVESLAVEEGCHAVVLVTDRDPGPRWVGVDRQVLMWDEYGTDLTPLERDSLFVGFYDVEMG